MVAEAAEGSAVVETVDQKVELARKVSMKSIEMGWIAALIYRNERAG